jgi:hypothetical protein
MTRPFASIALAVLTSALGLAACSSDDSTGGMPGQDSGLPPVDAATAPDASGTHADGSNPGVDSGNPPPVDGATPHDSSSPVDAHGTNDAAGTDAAGTDAGDVDSGGGSDAGGDGGLLPFASPCTANPQCASNLCYNFPAKGMFCTQSCQSATDCPGGAGGLGCNGMNVCRVP